TMSKWSLCVVALWISASSASAMDVDEVFTPAEGAASDAPKKAVRRHLGTDSRILVLRYRTPPDAYDSDAATKILLEKVRALPRSTVLTEQDALDIDGADEIIERLGAREDLDALLELGTRVGVDRVLSGTVVEVGGSTALSLVLVDVHAGMVEQRIAS